MAVRDIGDHACVQAGESIPRILKSFEVVPVTVMPGIDVEIAEIEKRNTRYSLLVRLDVGVNGIQKFNVVWLQTSVGLRGFRDAGRAQDVQTQPEVSLSCFVLSGNRFRLSLGLVEQLTPATTVTQNLSNLDPPSPHPFFLSLRS